MDPSDLVIKALAPAFASALAIQQLLELIDAIFLGSRVGPRKKAVLAIISFAGGLAIAGWGHIRVLDVLVRSDLATLDVIVTALIISGGTESFNSLLKFLFYKKEEQKAETAKEQLNVGSNALGLVNNQPPTPNLTLPAPTL